MARAWQQTHGSDLATTIRFALSRQLTVAGELVDALALSIVPTSLEAHAAKLQQLIVAGQAVLEERKTARFQRAEACPPHSSRSG